MNSKQFKIALIENGITREQWCNSTGVSYPTLQRWLTNDTLPLWVSGWFKGL